MDLKPLLLFLHIGLMFCAVAVAFGGELFLQLAYRSGQVGVVRGVALAVMKAGPLVPVLFVSGGLFGLFTAIAFGQNLLAPWLVIAYVGWVTGTLLGITGGRRLGARLGAALAAAPDGALTPELHAVFTDQTYIVGTLANVTVVFVVLFDMVVKPFS
jgi:hypothetical protein